MQPSSDLEMREALYRSLARQPGLPAGVRALMVERAACLSGSETPTAARGVKGNSPAWSFLFRPDTEGCKGAARR